MMWEGSEVYILIVVMLIVESVGWRGRGRELGLVQHQWGRGAVGAGGRAEGGGGGGAAGVVPSLGRLPHDAAILIFCWF